MLRLAPPCQGSGMGATPAELCLPRNEPCLAVSRGDAQVGETLAPAERKF